MQGMATTTKFNIHQLAMGDFQFPGSERPPALCYRISIYKCNTWGVAARTRAVTLLQHADS